MNRILVVEDEPPLREDLVDYLIMRGYAAQGVGTRPLREPASAGPHSLL